MVMLLVDLKPQMGFSQKSSLTRLSHIFSISNLTSSKPTRIYEIIQQTFIKYP